MYDDFSQRTLGGSENERITMDNLKNEPWQTDVKGVEADGYYAKGVDKFPVFNVSREEFYANPDMQRGRIPFEGKAAEYVNNTRTPRPFYVKFQDDGRDLVRKVK